MDLLKTDDKITIVNRSEEYRISRELIREIPYFERMLSHDLKESKENKVILDFDQQALKAILSCVEFGYMLIEMGTVINLCSMIDYFGMDNNLMDDCITYFHDNFSPKHLPVIIPQVTSISKCMSSDALNAFICRHFLKIAKTIAWSDYPIEIVDYILNLDLFVHSEKQVVNAILQWINCNVKFRMRYLKRLLNLVRWNHLDDADLSEIKNNDFFRSKDLQPVFWRRWKRNGQHNFNRTKQNYFIMIELLSGTNLHVKVTDSNFIQLFSRKVELDESMPLQVFHNEYVSDIFFDSGRRGIRIDWNRNKYRWLDLSTSTCYYLEIFKRICGSNGGMESKNADCRMCYKIEGSALLEINGDFVYIRFKHGRTLMCASIHTSQQLYLHQNHNFHATFLYNNIYILTMEFDLIRLDTDFHEIERTRLVDTYGKFEDILLTSVQSENRVILLHKATKRVHCFNIKSKEWSTIDNAINNDSSDCQMDSNQLIAFTSAFLPLETIRHCMNPELL